MTENTPMENRPLFPEKKIKTPLEKELDLLKEEIKSLKFRVTNLEVRLGGV
jgi:hypothetical protein